MRKNIKRLLKTRVTAYTLSKETEISISTANRILTGVANIDNITLKNAEILNNYYLNIERDYRIEKLCYAIDDTGSYDYSKIYLTLDDYLDSTFSDLNNLKKHIDDCKQTLKPGTGFRVVRMLYSSHGTNISKDFIAEINYSNIDKADSIIKSALRNPDIELDDNELNSIYLSNKN